jgi:hypothetical protein
VTFLSSWKPEKGLDVRSFEETELEKGIPKCYSESIISNTLLPTIGGKVNVPNPGDGPFGESKMCWKD